MPSNFIVFQIIQIATKFKFDRHVSFDLNEIENTG